MTLSTATRAAGALAAFKAEVLDFEVPFTQKRGAFLNRIRSLSATVPIKGSVAVLALLSACASTPPPKPAATDAAATGSASKPMVTQNPNGTITVQKDPSNASANGKKGLVVPPQVVAPMPQKTGTLNYPIPPSPSPTTQAEIFCKRIWSL